MKNVAIIGGGITGLSTAFYLKKWLKQEGIDLEVKLFEKNPSVGGKIQTRHQDDFIIEGGPDSFLARKEAGGQLLEDLNLTEAIIRNHTGQSYVFTDKGLHPMPEGTFMGLPVDAERFLKTNILTVEEKSRALEEINIPKGKASQDQSLGLFLKRRFGEAIVRQLLSPLLSGIYSSAIDDMSLMASFPQFYHYEQQYGSVLKGLRQEMPRNQGLKKGQFITLKNGLHAMTMALEKKLNSIIQTNEAVKSLVKQGETNILTTESGEKFEADMVVSTTPFPQMQALLPDDSFIQAQSIEQSSVANIALQYNRQDLKELPEGTGFVVASSSGLDMTACTWLHKKWPHTTPKNKLLLRTFIGRPHNQALLNLTDKQLIEKVQADLNASLGIDAKVEQTYLSKWLKQMPQYKVGHLESIKALRQYLNEAYPGVLIAGASYDGVGIPDCIQSAKQAAHAVFSCVSFK